MNNAQQCMNNSSCPVKLEHVKKKKKGMKPLKRQKRRSGRNNFYPNTQLVDTLKFNYGMFGYRLLLKTENTITK